MSSNSVTKQQVLIHLARTDLIVFCKLIDPSYRPGRVHKHLAKRLMRCSNKSDMVRLIVGMPPQHGKSRLISQLLCAWLLGVVPNIKIACASFASGRSDDNSRKTRDICRDPLYKLIFPQTVLRDDSQAVGMWETKNGGYYRAVGITGTLTGIPADLIIIDDPLKDAEEATSTGTLDKIFDWYITVARTRLSPTGKIIINMTRWATEDLVGKVLNPDTRKMLATLGLDEDWENLKYTAEAEENDILGRKVGEWLWPEKYGATFYLMQKALSPFWWSAQYQQNPTIKGGNFVKIDNFDIVDTAPALICTTRFWDLACGVEKQNDFTAGILGGLDKNGDFYILHCHNSKQEWGASADIIKQLAIKDRVPVGVEAVAGFLIAYQQLRDALAGVCEVYKATPQGSKESKTTGWISLLSARRVHLVRGSWNFAFLAQMGEFPKGKHDDIVDAVSGCYNRLKNRSSVTSASY